MESQLAASPWAGLGRGEGALVLSRTVADGSCQQFRLHLDPHLLDLCVPSTEPSGGDLGKTGSCPAPCLWT